MKLKSLLLTITATLGMYAVTKAQVPNYVPTDGLVGWWPFNGNANDESGNGNNGTVNGATLISDRFGDVNSAQYFNGISNIAISIPLKLSPSNSSEYSISCWYKASSNINGFFIQLADNNFNTSNYDFYSTSNQTKALLAVGHYPQVNASFAPDSIKNNIWSNILAVYKQSIDSVFIYKNGQYWFSGIIGNIPPSISSLYLGSTSNNTQNITGSLDDIGIWNRALTEKEVINLYNASICSNDLFITAQNNTLQTGGNVTFTATTSDANASYIWQSDLGQGYQTLNNYGNYSGTNSENLNISNLQLSNHNQAIRAISTTEECTDTSNVATIKLTDTCISLISVTDTLIINAQITNTNLPVKINTLKVFPNPASSQITIDYGNFNEMSGYTLTIVNSLGQSVFSTPINQQTSIINLSSMSGKGFYFIRVIDPQNNTIENRKLIIE